MARAWLLALILLARAGQADLPIRGMPGQERVGEPDTEAVEQALVAFLNRERLNHGLQPLIRLSGLVAVARLHSSDMAAHLSLSHAASSGESLSSRLVGQDLFFWKLGENIARSTAILAPYIHEAFMASPEHRANILDPAFNAVGIGAASLDGRELFITQDFLAAMRPLPEEEARIKAQRLIGNRRAAAGVSPLVYWDEADELARRLSETKIKGMSSPGIPMYFGPVRAVFLTIPDLETWDWNEGLFLEERFSRAGLGICFGRDPLHPGGAYFLTFLKIEESPYAALQGLPRPPSGAAASRGNLNEETLAGLILQEINVRRNGRGLLYLMEEDSLSRIAAGVLASTVQGRRADRADVPEGAFQRILIYTTFDHTDLSPETWLKLLNPAYNRIGIRAAFGKTKEYPLGALYVVIVLDR